MNLSVSTCRKLAIAGIVCAAVSLMIFGAVLDFVGLILGLVALFGVRKAILANPQDMAAKDTYRLAKIAIVLPCIAGVVNLAATLILNTYFGEMLSEVATEATESIF